MEWTKTPPAEAGWYWWKDENMVPAIVYLCKSGHRPDDTFQAGADYPRYSSKIGGEWAGPLTPPK